MSKKYWTYDLSKTKKSGAKLLNHDFESFLGYADSYNTWKIKKWNKSTYIASINGFKNYGSISFSNKGKNLKSGISNKNIFPIKTKIISKNKEYQNNL